MPEINFNNRQRGKILKNVLKKTYQYYEEAVREQESKEIEVLFEEESKK